MAASPWWEALETAGRWTRRELLSLWHLEFVPEGKREAMGFALRGWLACILATYVAFYLQLDEPYWATLTVWIVLQPTPGMSISKAYYRVIGTLIGCTAGVTIFCIFVQTPELFVAALATWIGCCTCASNLLRNYRAYAAIMAGFTAVIIATGAIAHPENILQIALSRCAATLTGIGCAAAVTSLFAPHKAREKVRGLLRKGMSDALRRAAIPITATMADRLAQGKPLIDELIALDAEIDYAAAESAGFRIHQDGARSLVAHLFGAISAKRSLEEELERAGPVVFPEAAQALAKAMILFEKGPERIESGNWIELEKELEDLRKELGKMEPEKAALALQDGVSARTVIDRLDDLLRHLSRAIYDWRQMLAGYKWRPSLSLNFHSDRRMAVIHGLRAFLAMGLAGAFWIASAWPSGPGLLIWVGLGVSFFTSAPRPDVLATLFLKLTILATVAAAICNFWILENVTGFPLLAATYALFFIPAVLYFYDARNPIPTMAYCANLIAVSQPLNVMTYNVALFLNNTIALIVGMGASVIAYRLFMPPNPHASRRYVVYRIRRGLEIISQHKPIASFSAWQTRMFDRINRLHDPENPAGWPTDEWFNGGLAALNLGNNVLRLRYLLEERQLRGGLEEPVRSVLQTFGEVTRHPDSAKLAVEKALQAIEPQVPEAQGERVTWFRVMGVLEKMEAFFVEHPMFLTGKTTTL